MHFSIFNFFVSKRMFGFEFIKIDGLPILTRSNEVRISKSSCFLEIACYAGNGFSFDLGFISYAIQFVKSLVDKDA